MRTWSAAGSYTTFQDSLVFPCFGREPGGLVSGYFLRLLFVGRLHCLLLFLGDSKSVAIEMRNMRRKGMSRHMAVKLLECGAKTLIPCRLGRVGEMWYDEDSD